MANKKQKHFYTTTASTFDIDAIAINSELNDVTRMIRIGHQLMDILNGKFGGDEKAFKRYIKMNIDKDEKSVMRYICLANNEDMLKTRGLIRLSEAYEVLGIDGNPKEWMVEEAA